MKNGTEGLEIVHRDISSPPESNPVRVLMFEDSESDALLICSELEASFDCEVKMAWRLSEGLTIAREKTFDVILLDLGLPDSNGHRTLDMVHQALPEIPVIVLTGLREFSDPLEVLRRGAQDYLLKGSDLAPLLVRSISNAIERHRLMLERDARARQLRESESRIRMIIDANVDAMVVVDRHGTIEFANPMAAQMFGLSADGLIGEPFGFPVGEDHVTELDIIRHDGSTGIAEMRVVSLKWGEEPSFLATLRDITERKRVQEEIELLNTSLEERVCERTSELEAANRELDAFCHTVSHDLRSPLTHILSFAEIMELKFANSVSEEGKRYLAQITRSAKRMGNLIRDFLNFATSKRMDLMVETIDLSEIARSVMDELRQSEPSRQVELKIDKEILVRGDFGLLFIVLENLLGNAWKFTSKRVVSKIHVGATRKKSGAQVCCVRDNGAGFDMEKAGQLFDPFKRMHSKEEFSGTGVGLATVHRIISRHGGQIWANAAPDKGATFFFTLPDHPPSEEST